MSGMPGRSGGWNRISVEDHLARGTYRKDRHGHLQEPPTDTYSDVDRDRLVAGLPAAAERLALALLESFSGWDPASLVTLRSTCCRVSDSRRWSRRPAMTHGRCTRSFAAICCC